MREPLPNRITGTRHLTPFTPSSSDHFLKNGGHVVISIKASCIDSTAPAEAVFASEVNKMKAAMIKPHEQLTLEPYERVSRCPVSSGRGLTSDPSRLPICRIIVSWSEAIVSLARVCV